MLALARQLDLLRNVKSAAKKRLRAVVLRAAKDHLTTVLDRYQMDTDTVLRNAVAMYSRMTAVESSNTGGVEGDDGKDSDAADHAAIRREFEAQRRQSFEYWKAWSRTEEGREVLSSLQGVLGAERVEKLQSFGHKLQSEYQRQQREQHQAVPPDTVLVPSAQPSTHPASHHLTSLVLQQSGQLLADSTRVSPELITATHRLASSRDAQRALLKQIKDSAMGFLLEYVPRVVIPATEGVNDTTEYAIGAIDLSGFKVDSEKVTVRLPAPGVVKIRVEDVECSLPEIEWRFRQTAFPYFSGGGDADAIASGVCVELELRLMELSDDEDDDYFEDDYSDDLDDTDSDAAEEVQEGASRGRSDSRALPASQRDVMVKGEQKRGKKKKTAEQRERRKKKKKKSREQRLAEKISRLQERLLEEQKREEEEAAKAAADDGDSLVEARPAMAEATGVAEEEDELCIGEGPYEGHIREGPVKLREEGRADRDVFVRLYPHRLCVFSDAAAAEPIRIIPLTGETEILDVEAVRSSEEEQPQQQQSLSGPSEEMNSENGEIVDPLRHASSSDDDEDSPGHRSRPADPEEETSSTRAAEEGRPPTWLSLLSGPGDPPLYFLSEQSKLWLEDFRVVLRVVRRIEMLEAEQEKQQPPTHPVESGKSADGQEDTAHPTLAVIRKPSAAERTDAPVESSEEEQTLSRLKNWFQLEKLHKKALCVTKSRVTVNQFSLTITKSRLSRLYNLLLGLFQGIVRSYIESSVNETLSANAVYLSTRVNAALHRWLPLAQDLQEELEDLASDPVEGLEFWGSHASKLLPQITELTAAAGDSLAAVAMQSTVSLQDTLTALRRIAESGETLETVSKGHHLAAVLGAAMKEAKSQLRTMTHSAEQQKDEILAAVSSGGAAREERYRGAATLRQEALLLLQLIDAQRRDSPSQDAADGEAPEAGEEGKEAGETTKSTTTTEAAALSGGIRNSILNAKQLSQQLLSAVFHSQGEEFRRLGWTKENFLTAPEFRGIRDAIEGRLGELAALPSGEVIQAAQKQLLLAADSVPSLVSSASSPALQAFEKHIRSAGKLSGELLDRAVTEGSDPGVCHVHHPHHDHSSRLLSEIPFPSKIVSSSFFLFWILRCIVGDPQRTPGRDDGDDGAASAARTGHRDRSPGRPPSEDPFRLRSIGSQREAEIAGTVGATAEDWNKKESLGECVSRRGSSRDPESTFPCECLLRCDPETSLRCGNGSRSELRAETEAEERSFLRLINSIDIYFPVLRFFFLSCVDGE